MENRLSVWRTLNRVVIRLAKKLQVTAATHAFHELLQTETKTKIHRKLQNGFTPSSLVIVAITLSARRFLVSYSSLRVFPSIQTASS